MSKLVILNIDVIIKQFFIEKSQAVIPGIGTLYSLYQKAQIITDRKIIDPPGYKIGFNPLLKLDPDRELENYLCLKLKLAGEESKTQLDQFVKHLIDSVEKSEKVPLADLGYFYLDPQSKNISFHSETDKSFLPDTFGLQSIDADPILQLDEPENSPKATVNKAKVKYLYWLLPTLIILCLAIIIILINNNKDSSPNSKDSYAVDTKIQKYDSKKIDSLKIDKTLDSNYISSTKTKNALYYKEEERIVDAIVDSLTANTKNTQAFKSYYIIAGSFSNLKNAKRLYNTLLKDGYNPEILNSDTNIYRVSLNRYTSLHDAVKELDQLKSGNIEYNVWISTR